LLAVLYSGLIIALVYASSKESDGGVRVAGARSFYGALNIYELQDKEKGMYLEMVHGIDHSW